MKNFFRFATLTAVLLCAPFLFGHNAPAYEAKIWTNDGDIWILDHVVDRGFATEWHYWAQGEEGTLDWNEIDWIVFLENLHPNRYAKWNREIPRGRRATVHFNSGETRELYVEVDLLHGKDAYGTRKIYGDDVTRVDFLENSKSTVFRCANGHVWIEEGYQFCPYDKQPLAEYEQY